MTFSPTVLSTVQEIVAGREMLPGTNHSLHSIISITVQTNMTQCPRWETSRGIKGDVAWNNNCTTSETQGKTLHGNRYRALRVRTSESAAHPKD
jgi:hypothetical protein